MNLSCKLQRYKLPAIAIAVLTLLMTPAVARAFDLSTYTGSSVLSSGNWVKVSVQSSGIYLITNSQLKSWGFNDPSKVRIYGYGGQRMSDRLTIADYTDDLPPVPCEAHSPRPGVLCPGSGDLDKHHNIKQPSPQMEPLAQPFHHQGLLLSL